MPHVNSGVRGTLHVHLDVHVPTKLDAGQSAALSAYRETSGEQIDLVTTTAAAAPGGLFSRLRNAFAGR